VLAKNKAHTWNETGTFYGMGEGLPFKAAYASQLPDQFKMAVENVFTIVLDGNKGWVNDNGMSAEQIAELKENNYAGWVSTLLPLKDKAFTLTAIEDIKIGDQPRNGNQGKSFRSPTREALFQQGNRSAGQSRRARKAGRVGR